MWGQFQKTLKNEPVRVINSIIGIIQALVLLFAAFGMTLSPNQISTISGVLVAIGTLINLVYTREQVTPVANPHTNDGRPLVPAGSSGSQESNR